MAKVTKRMKASLEAVPAQAVTVKEAVDAILAQPATKFDESIDVAIKLGVDPRHADQMVRGSIALPNGTGKTVRVAVFAKGPKAEEATAAGADIVGADDLVEKVQGGFMDFDRVVATPDMMAQVGKLGRVFGPRGLMPNPKTGTVTPDVVGAVKNAKAGQVRFRTDKHGIIHGGLGKISFKPAAIKQNLEALILDLKKAKPSTAKGQYLKKVTLSTTMGPGLPVDLSSLDI